VPLAFFPLTGASLQSMLLPPYNGGLSGVPPPSWVPEPTFYSVLNCSAVSGGGGGGVVAVRVGEWLQRLLGEDAATGSTCGVKALCGHKLQLWRSTGSQSQVLQCSRYSGAWAGRQVAHVSALPCPAPPRPALRTFPLGCCRRRVIRFSWTTCPTPQTAHSPSGW